MSALRARLGPARLGPARLLTRSSPLSSSDQLEVKAKGLLEEQPSEGVQHFTEMLSQEITSGQLKLLYPESGSFQSTDKLRQK